MYESPDYVVYTGMYESPGHVIYPGMYESPDGLLPAETDNV